MGRKAQRIALSRKDILFLIPLIPLLGLFIYAVTPKEKSITCNTSGIEVSTFVDSGNTEILKHSGTEDGITLQYRMGNEAVNPFVGTGLFVTDTANLIDISKYDFFTVELDPLHSDDAEITLHFFIPGYSTIENGLSQRYKKADLEIEPNKKSYNIDIHEDLHTPSWWYVINDIQRQKLPKEDYTRFAGISFSNHPLAKVGEKYEISIKRITFKKHPDKMASFWGVIFLIYITIYLIIQYYAKKRAVFIPYEKVKLEENTDSDLEVLTSFLNKHYTLHTLTQTTATEKTGLKASQIRQIIQETYGKSFKQYITDLRITEAKRLIIETDNKISKIASAIGYPHTSTFNHIFKEYTGHSPNEYKKKHSRIKTAC